MGLKLFILYSATLVEDSKLSWISFNIFTVAVLTKHSCTFVFILSSSDVSSVAVMSRDEGVLKSLGKHRLWMLSALMCSRRVNIVILHTWKAAREEYYYTQQCEVRLLRN